MDFIKGERTERKEDAEGRDRVGVVFFAGGWILVHLLKVWFLWIS